MYAIAPDSHISDIPGFRLGHWSHHTARTGCTTLIFDAPALASVHIAGGAPGTAETDILDPAALVTGIDALLLTGGSAFGLDAAGGVRRYLEEQGRGFRAGPHRVPLVPTAVLFDLGCGDGSKRPGADEGYQARWHCGGF